MIFCTPNKRWAFSSTILWCRWQCQCHFRCWIVRYELHCSVNSLACTVVVLAEETLHSDCLFDRRCYLGCVRVETNYSVVGSSFEILRNLPVWTQTDVIHQCISIFQTSQTSCWMIVSILNHLYRLSRALWPLNAKKWISIFLICYLC